MSETEIEVRKYFTDEKWNDLSEYMKRRHKTVYENYKFMLQLDIVCEPDYMISFERMNQRKSEAEDVAKPEEIEEKKPVPKRAKKKIQGGIRENARETTTRSQRNVRVVNYAENGNEAKTLGQIENKENRPLAETTSRPKRNRKYVNYSEEDVPNDTFIYCDDCEDEFIYECFIHGPLKHIVDTPVPMGEPDKAKRTVPERKLTVKESAIDGLGVWTLENIPKGTKFGPYDGVHRKSINNSGYSWKLRKPMEGFVIDAEDETKSNWMRFVNCSRNLEEQNLHPFQHCGGIYYRTVRDIKKDEELLVYYGDEFAKELKIDVKNYMEPNNNGLKKKMFRCSACKLSFKSPLSLEEHVKRCNDENNNEIGAFQCKNCDLGFYKESYRDMHQEKYCQKRFIQRPLVNDGKECVQKLDANDGIKSRKMHDCKFCTYSTHKLTHFKNHMDAIHEKRRDYTCTECNDAFTQKGHLKTHIESIHLKLNKHSCTFCNYKTNRNGNLNTHIQLKHTKDKSFKCSICNKTFGTSSYLKTHTKHMHTFEKPHKCEYCNYASAQSGNLKMHVKYKHAFEKPFKCAHCSYACVRSDKLKIHVSQRHK